MRLMSQKMQKPERLKKTVKHKNKTQEVQLSDSELVSFVEIAKVKLPESSIYPKSLVNELKSYTVDTVCFSETDLSTLKDIYGYSNNYV